MLEQDPILMVSGMHCQIIQNTRLMMRTSALIMHLLVNSRITGLIQMDLEDYGFLMTTFQRHIHASLRPTLEILVIHTHQTLLILQSLYNLLHTKMAKLELSQAG